MKTDKMPQTIHLSDYQAPTYLIPEIHLDFDLQEDFTILTATSRVQRTTTTPESTPLILEGSQLDLLQVKINGKNLSSSEYKQDEESLRLDMVPAEFELEVQTRLRPQDNKAFSGLYKTQKIYCTQMEAQGFRRITYFADRPDVLSRYTTTIRADQKKYPFLLSNGDQIEAGKLENGRHFVRWQDPFPKPCYLFALVAGDLALVEDTYTTLSGRKVKLQIFTDHGNESRCAHAMQSLKESMKWDEDVYGLEYDLNVYMIVAVDDFNMGAMENKGLNIFNSKFVLADKESATDAEFMGIQTVIGHEYFHNWSGNRVTCRDWFQLSLKEGLTVFRDQEFSSDLNSRPVKRIEDVIQLRTRQFPEDASGMAHPVRPPSYIAIDNFYTRTVYDKGAEVIRMMQTLLGRDAFIKGVRHYFQKHDGQAVTTDDFVQCLEESSGRDLQQFKNWYDQAGTPTLKAQGTYDADKKVYRLKIRQSCQNPVTKKENKPYHLPVKIGLLNKDGKEFPLQLSQGQLSAPGVLDVRQTEEIFVFENITEKPVLSLLREFSAPVLLEMESSEEDLIFLMQKDQDSFNRWESAQRLFQNSILENVQALQKGQELKALSTKLLEAFRSSLPKSSKDDLAFAAKLLAPPSVQYVMQFCVPLEPQLLEKAYDHFVLTLQKSLAAEMQKLSDQLNQQTPATEAEAMASRSLQQVLWTYLSWKGDNTQAEALYKSYKNAQNMTESIQALSLLSHLKSEKTEQAWQDFLERWKKDSLVLNKWFAVQAQSLREDAAERVRELSQLPQFDKTNPNKLFSLYYAFASMNPFRFHQDPKRNYTMLAEVIVDVDRRNPQVASRLATSFNDWTRWAPALRQEAKEQILFIKNSPQISKNVYEIMERALNMETGNSL